MSMEQRYRDMMEQVKPPADMEDRIVAHVEKMRRGGVAEERRRQVARKPAPAHAAAGRAPRRRRPLPFAAKAAAASIAAVLVGTAIIAFPLLPSGDPSEGQQEGSIASSLEKAFGLELCAEAPEEGRAVAIATDESGIRLQGRTGSNPTRSLQYLMNLTCVGEDIQTITYAIEGEGVCFEQVILKESLYGEVNPSTYTLVPELSVEYDNQHPENQWQRIAVDVLPEELRECRDRELSVSERLSQTDDPAERDALIDEAMALEREMEQGSDILMDELYSGLGESDFSGKEKLRAETEAMEKIGRSVLSVTATFSDGSTATKQYRIAPVDDFEQVLRDRYEATGPDDPRMAVPLFEIVELS